MQCYRNFLPLPRLNALWMTDVATLNAAFVLDSFDGTDLRSTRIIQADRKVLTGFQASVRQHALQQKKRPCAPVEKVDRAAVYRSMAAKDGSIRNIADFSYNRSSADYGERLRRFQTMRGKTIWFRLLTRKRGHVILNREPNIHTRGAVYDADRHLRCKWKRKIYTCL